MFSMLISRACGFLYSRLLIVLLIAAGIYFTLFSGFVQIRMLPEAIRVAGEKPKNGGVSSFGALMVSTACRVGTGNIVGVSTAVCLGGSGAVFWMWLIAVLGGATSFAECTLSQIFKRRVSGGFYGGPACYIEACTKRRWPSVLFCVMLIITYGVGFSMLTSYNAQASFCCYSFYDTGRSPWLIGALLAVFCLAVLVCGGKGIISVSEILVPTMGIMYVLISLIVTARNIELLPRILRDIFSNAFEFRPFLSGLTCSGLTYGIKRGLFSNEAGVGSAPNAAAAADISHPVKQGLVQMLSVFIDTLILCSATAFMCLCSGVSAHEDLAGIPYIQAALENNFGPAGPVFLTVAVLLFAFTTLIGNFFYIDNCMSYILRRPMRGAEFYISRITGCAVIFLGAGLPMALVWDLADFMMALMCLINIPAILALRGTVSACLKNYIKQMRCLKDPVFHASDIGLENTQLWR